MTEDGLIAKLRRDAREELHYFGNRNKSERECWVVSEFLRIMRVNCDVLELIAPPQHSHVDVHFRDNGFQVKEITDPNLRRTAEAKEYYERILKASPLEELELPLRSSDYPEITTAYELVENLAQSLIRSGKYGDRIGEMDLLAYITRKNAGRVSKGELGRNAFVEMGWRSVSFVMGPQAGVLWVSETGSSLLKTLAREQPLCVCCSSGVAS